MTASTIAGSSMRSSVPTRQPWFRSSIIRRPVAIGQDHLGTNAEVGRALGRFKGTGTSI